MRVRKLIKPKYLPKYIGQFKCVKGIAVGGCVDRRDSIEKENTAHAHNYQEDKYFGWICVRFNYSLRDKKTILHEIAHLIACGRGHDKVWKDTVVKIGGTYKSYMVKRKSKFLLFSAYK